MPCWGYYYDLIKVLTLKELKVRYQRTYLGYVWSLLNPLTYAVVYWIAFKAVLNVKIDNYLLFLLAGLFPWQWLSNALNNASRNFVSNTTLVKKVRFPRHVIVAASVLDDALHFVLTLPVMAALILAYGKPLHLAWLWGVPMLFVIQCAMLYGVALALATINVFFRDLERLVWVFLTIAFYVTPVIFAEDMIPANFKPLFAFNPLTYLVVSWRNLLLYGTVSWSSVAIAGLFSAACVAVGQIVYGRMQWRLAEAL